MTVTTTLGEIGTFAVQFRSATPLAVLNGIGAFPLLQITKAHVPAAVAATIDRPMYRGTILARDHLALSGADMAWHYGSFSNKLLQTSGFGPWYQRDFTKITVAGAASQLAAAAGGFGSVIESPVSGSRQIRVPADCTPRTALQKAVLPQANCEWRVRTNGVLALYHGLKAIQNPVATIIDDPGGKDPTVLSWRLASSKPQVDWAEFRNSIRYSWVNDQDVKKRAGGSTGAGLNRTYQNGVMTVAVYHDFGDVRAEDMSDVRDDFFLPMKEPVTVLTVEVDDPAPMAALENPDEFVGSSVWVYDPAIGIYNQANPPVTFRGRSIFPVPLRVTEVTWPLTRGMGVYIDARWSRDGSGKLIDVTEWVDWEADPAAPGSSTTTMHLGGLPHWWDGRGRRI